jgi:ubiquinone/menaquinone biosynthesis C-methylase UbiE
VPAAARDEQRLADTRLWRMAEARVARRALAPFRVRPSLRRLRVLNLDHGPGGVAAALARQAPQDSLVLAVDPLEGMADLARNRAARWGHRAPLDFARAWSFSLPFADGSFDLVVSAVALHQWPNPEAVLGEIARVLTPQGRYFILDLRRDMPVALWLLAQLVQTFLTPKDLRNMGEPGASIGAAYAPHEAEWFAARAKLPDLRIARGPAWITIERTNQHTQ